MNSPASSNPPKYILGAALGLTFITVAVVLAASLGGGDRPSQPGSADEPTGAPQPEPRAVLVTDDRMPQPSPSGSALNALLISGSLPARPSVARVLTDEDCAPDERGISRCLNRVRLAGGETLNLRHPHRMMEVPCLSPGERIAIRPT